MRLPDPIRLESLPEPTGGGDFTPIPAGIYRAELTACELRQTKAGTGSYLNIRADVMDGPHAGRVVFGMITVTNPNSQAVEIGQGQLRELLRAVGLNTLEDTDQLVGRRCQIKVGIDERDGYEPKNNIKGWRPIEIRAKPAAAAEPRPAAARTAPPAEPYDAGGAAAVPPAVYDDEGLPF